MADEDRLRVAATVLAPAAEHEWALLRELVDFADRLVVAFVFADRFPVRVLRARLQREARKSGMPFRLVVCDEPDALRNEALAAVLSPEADHEITWFEAFGAEEALRQAWHFAAQRWNEHREPLRRSSLRALIVAAPIWAKPVIRLAAPDLWSITNLVIEPAALPAPPFSEAPERIEQHVGGTAAEQEVAATWVESLLKLHRGIRRDRELMEALADAVRAGAWHAAARAADALDLSPHAIRRLVNRAKRAGEEASSMLAASLNNLGGHLASLGRRDDALRIAQVASDLFRDLAKSRPATFLPHLALSLSNLGNRLGELSRETEAIAVTREAVNINRDLIATQADEIRPVLAMSLNNLSLRLRNLGFLEEALAAAQQASEIFGGLADKPQSPFRPGLAKSLNNQGSLLLTLGLLPDALVLSREAVAIGRSLAESDPAAFLPTLAATLNNLGNVLGGLGQHEDALSAVEESVAITAGLARSRPEVFLPYLSFGIRNLARRLELANRDLASSAALRDGEALLASAGGATSLERQ